MTELIQYDLTQNMIVQNVADKLEGITKKQIGATLKLLNEGATVPFIARYRKEMTGELDEVQIRDIQSVARKSKELAERKNTVLKAISEQNKLTADLQENIQNVQTMQELEDVYLPYKQKRRTKAMIARENGLQPLADWLMSHLNDTVDSAFLNYINESVPTLADVYAGIHEILAEKIGENANYRQWLRVRMGIDGLLVAKIKRGAADKDEQKVYEQYYDFNETIKSLVNNKFRILAINRGEKEGVLSVKIDFAEARIIHFIQTQELNGQKPMGEGFKILRRAIEDAYKRFIGPAVEREIRQELTTQAQNQAINVFGDNLYHLLMQAPLKDKIVMGFDPGFRTGSKLAIIDKNGKFLAKQVIYPHKPANADKRAEAGAEFKRLVTQYNVELVAIGNGTASRESEEFVSNNLPDDVKYTIVNEAGASVYSASEEARKEFPELHVEERSAISIGRRIQDPLAELIKIDPKAVGVGQYQHDLNAKALDEQVDTVIETAVNQVGVNLNTASPALLAHIAGLNSNLAKNIVNYRNEIGEFTARSQIKKVPRLGPKSYEQAAGFLRIVDGKNILDNTDIHPESYAAAKQLLVLAGVDSKELATEGANLILNTLDNEKTANQLNIGVQTLHDIVKSLQKPGRDGRSEMVGALLKSDVLHIEDLQADMKLQGTVRNVVDFGAFVDLGVKHDGLVHISRMSKRRVKHPSEIVSVGDIVEVWVVEVDEKRNRIGLTMLPPQ
ncbi:S1 RNA-binding protein [Leuconostoc litchii]|uniref:RNA-binding transcriptional accessory protein n=1 Tax=Leuconostoc litchii TaxID=1981069 RepID=A0A6P2CNX9_9LACO|nr:Tex family protein [Leuconostoc litchii]TYC46802.1 RNA-binding transcriptional accessory protein [Leuconostoc litchii]GMA70692.1 S1 RNA-binding protein [Leuconostoc litchii]